ARRSAAVRLRERANFFLPRLWTGPARSSIYAPRWRRRRPSRQGVTCRAPLGWWWYRTLLTRGPGRAYKPAPLGWGFEFFDIVKRGKGCAGGGASRGAADARADLGSLCDLFEVPWIIRVFGPGMNLRV